LKLSENAQSVEFEPQGEPLKITYIRQGKVCPIVRRKNEPDSVYIVTGHSLCGIDLECVYPEPSLHYETFDDLYGNYTDIPPELLFLKDSMYSTFMPIVFLNDD